MWRPTLTRFYITKLGPKRTGPYIIASGQYPSKLYIVDSGTKSNNTIFYQHTQAGVYFVFLFTQKGGPHFSELKC